MKLMRPANIETAALIAALLFIPCSVRAQAPSPSLERDWTTATRGFWHVDGGYPIRASLGSTLVIGRSSD